MVIRDTWDEYFSKLAAQVATRSTCDRKHVGAVIVRRLYVVSTGYNGSVKGLPHCDDVGHLIVDNHCIRTVHAEVNAIAQAACHGAATEGATIYVSASPCWPCFKMMVNAGIKRVCIGENYRQDPSVLEAASSLGIELSGDILDVG